MTVAELVEILLECHQGSEVVIYDYQRGKNDPIHVKDSYPGNEVVGIYCDRF